MDGIKRNVKKMVKKKKNMKETFCKNKAFISNKVFEKNIRKSKFEFEI